MTDTQQLPPPITETLSGVETSCGANTTNTSATPASGIITSGSAAAAAAAGGGPSEQQQQQQFITTTPANMTPPRNNNNPFSPPPQPSSSYNDTHDIEELSTSHSHNDESTEPVSVMTGSVGSTSNTSADDDGGGASEKQRTSLSFGRFIQKTRKRLSVSHNTNNDGVDDINPAEDDNNNEHQHQHYRLGTRNTTSKKFIDETNIIDSEGVSISKAHTHRGPMISGYLHKLGRNGKWQRRWFETDGEDLTYYKSENRTQILAKLDLCKVGVIEIDNSDTSQCTFKIQVAGRPYSLRTESCEKCKYWVITLNRIKEAKMHLGGLGLVSSLERLHPPDLLDRSRTASEDYTERIAVNAQRQRTHAVMMAGNDQDIKTSWEQVLLEQNSQQQQQQQPLPPDFLSNSPRVSTKMTPSSSTADYNDAEEEGIETTMASSPSDHNQLIRITDTALPDGGLAQWQKSRAVVYRMSMRLVRWYRRMKMLRCKSDHHHHHHHNNINNDNDIIQFTLETDPHRFTGNQTPTTTSSKSSTEKKKKKANKDGTNSKSLSKKVKNKKSTTPTIITTGVATDSAMVNDVKQPVLSFRGNEGESLSEWISREKDREQQSGQQQNKTSNNSSTGSAGGIGGGEDSCNISQRPSRDDTSSSIEVAAAAAVTNNNNDNNNVNDDNNNDDEEEVEHSVV